MKVRRSLAVVRQFPRERLLAAWVEEQRKRLYRGHVKAIIRDLKQALAVIPVTGPGNKGKRKRLDQTITYLDGSGGTTLSAAVPVSRKL